MFYMQETPQTTLCKYHLQGYCYRGETCWYSHDLVALPPQVCKYHVSGGCTDENCQKEHSIPQQWLAQQCKRAHVPWLTHGVGDGSLADSSPEVTDLSRLSIREEAIVETSNSGDDDGTRDGKPSSPNGKTRSPQQSTVAVESSVSIGTGKSSATGKGSSRGKVGRMYAGSPMADRGNVGMWHGYGYGYDGQYGMPMHGYSDEMGYGDNRMNWVQDWQQGAYQDYRASGMDGYWQSNYYTRTGDGYDDRGMARGKQGNAYKKFDQSGGWQGGQVVDDNPNEYDYWSVQGNKDQNLKASGYANWAGGEMHNGGSTYWKGSKHAVGDGRSSPHGSKRGSPQWSPRGSRQQRKAQTNSGIFDKKTPGGTSQGLEASKKLECVICLENILGKPAPSHRKFGLMDCEHPFCIQCIRTWRGQDSQQNLSLDQAIRTCPICRVQTHFVTPSSRWPESQEDKQRIVDSYKKKLGGIDCKHFNQGRGKCPFGSSCFYRHKYADGTIEANVVRKVGTADGVKVMRESRLSDFLVSQNAIKLLKKPAKQRNARSSNTPQSTSQANGDVPVLEVEKSNQEQQGSVANTVELEDEKSVGSTSDEHVDKSNNSDDSVISNKCSSDETNTSKQIESEQTETTVSVSDAANVSRTLAHDQTPTAEVQLEA